MTRSEVLLIFAAALGTALSVATQSEGRESKLEDVWRPVQTLRHIRYRNLPKRDENVNHGLATVRKNYTNTMPCLRVIFSYLANNGKDELLDTLQCLISGITDELVRLDFVNSTRNSGRGKRSVATNSTEFNSTVRYLEEENEVWSKVDTYANIVKGSNGSKSEKTDDASLLQGFLSNSLPDLRSPGFETHPVIVSAPQHQSLDDLILHHTGSTGVLKPNRPTVILIQDAPPELLPKPPPNYQPSQDYPYYPSTPSYQHYEPYPEPEYVPVNPPVKPSTQKPYYDYSKPVYQQNKPSYKPTYDPVPEPEHVPIYMTPSTPVYEPIPEPEVTHNYHPTNKPFYQHTPKPEHVPIHQGKPIFKPHNDPVPESDHVPVFLYPKPVPEAQSTKRPMEPTPSPKPAVPDYPAPGPVLNAPLGPTLIFVNPTPPSPSPLNPVTIPSGQPPPSIVLLPPLNDIPQPQDEPIPPSTLCSSVHVSNTQHIHTHADFKDECGDVNVIINAPVSAEVSEGAIPPDYEDVGEQTEEEEEDEEVDDPESSGGNSVVPGTAVIPAPIVIGGGGGVQGASAAAGGAAAAAPSRPIQNTPIQASTTKRPPAKPSSMSVWEYVNSIFNSLILYPIWTVVFAPFSLILASGLGVAALVFPWAFPRLWFGRRTRRKRRSIPFIVFEPVVPAFSIKENKINESGLLFERRLKTRYNFTKDFET